MSEVPKLGCVNHDCDKCQSSEPVLASAMTLRDYFAAKAMQGDISNYQDEEVCGLTPSITNETLLQYSKVYYRMADAMLLAREAK